MTTLPHWNRLIQLAAASGAYTQCMGHYAALLAAGLRGGDASTFPSLAKSCAALRLPRLGRSLHAHALLAGAASDVFVRTSLLDMYAKCACLPDARRLFDEMPSRTLVSWNCMVTAYSKSSHVEEAVAMFNAMRGLGVRPSAGTLVGLMSWSVNSMATRSLGLCLYGYSLKSGLDADLPVLNSVLTMLVRGGQLHAARLIFDSMSEKSVVSWSAMASGFLQVGNYMEVFGLFNRMQAAGHKLDSVALVNLISAAVLLGNLLVAKGMHALLVKSGFESEKDLVSSLVNLYARCGDLEAAQELFDAVHMKDVVLWTSMITGYVEGGYPDKALTMFDSMLRTDVEPNEATVSSALSACADLGSANQAKKVEDHVVALGLQSDLRVATALIDRYCKCGSVELARKIFDGVNITSRDLAIWSAMINGYACNGEGSEALFLFSEMQKEGVQPDAIVFTHLLTACNYSGLVDEGLRCFRSLTEEYGIEPSVEHYMCIIDLLCKSGHISIAKEFFKKMPIKLQNLVLAPIVSASSSHCADSSMDLVSEELLNLDPQNSGHCILISNMLSCLGEWKKARTYRKLLSKQALVKEPGLSCIELSG
ncbi:pentatricopeptide repeat-containing protein At1g11290, chloroplastic isoform X1 [Lolium perenne]|uniref:pentatricopeptide repeat-containing protein At1g11290, chloroplastic isoform X1 n=1 Tax=Lolium perenne TaxID=4522 RepID=UPI0021EAECC7|nr:pentatricopeptide repeat-containing protein At3g12770-like [Lolium perenne]XP_051203703.1 pentatricopeptide repeat-containing protein At3g12770-like [Lolium perenne]